MKTPTFLPLTSALAFAVLAGCSSPPVRNEHLEQARADYRAADENPATHELASAELKQAGDALANASDTWSRNSASLADVNHLAYLATQQTAIAQQTASRRQAEQAVAHASVARDQLRLAARTREADTAQAQASASQLQSQESQRQARVAQHEMNDAQARSAALEAELKDMNAKKTDRGMVVTIGDVLFDTNKAQLKSGGMRGVEKLAGFLNQYPQRKAMVEGFTDSTGSEGKNQELSDRRANAVRAALVGMGISADRVAARGYGEAFPVAGNDNSGGRQMNRRVEIVLSDDTGTIAPR